MICLTSSLNLDVREMDFNECGRALKWKAARLRGESRCRVVFVAGRSNTLAVRRLYPASEARLTRRGSARWGSMAIVTG